MRYALNLLMRKSFINNDLRREFRCPEGAEQKVLSHQTPNEILERTICRPFQGGPVIGNILGLKPQAESFHPFGIILTGLSGTGRTK